MHNPDKIPESKNRYHRAVRQVAGSNPPVHETAQMIIRDLHALANPTRAQGVQQYFKHAIVALGIDAPTLQDYARQKIKAIKAAWVLADGVALCDRLLQEPELEIRGAGTLILSSFKKEFTPQLTAPAEKWLRTRLDNWALVDSFCGCVLSPLLEQFPPIESTLRQWSHDPTLWVRRAALVTLVPFARRGRLLDLAYELARVQFSDREDLMHKATGWLLREAGKTDQPRLRSFLLHHGPAIPRTALRYALEKFPVQERMELLAATRPAKS